ncbi:MAG TPA: Spy/CpxP family protein refolding chaperone [Geothrix sp.]|nr:Spy/CpxP family protein refolding chaperone [Geothrix sp.]
MNSLLRSTLILALAALPLAAQGYPEGCHRAQRISRALNLTDAQKTSIEAIHEKHRPDMLVRRDAARQAQTALRAALQDASTPEAQLRTLHDKASAARFDMMLARRAVHQEVLAVLTPEQRAKAAEMRTRTQERMRDRMHHLRMAAGLPS